MLHAWRKTFLGRKQLKIVRIPNSEASILESEPFKPHRCGSRASQLSMVAPLGESSRSSPDGRTNRGREEIAGKWKHGAFFLFSTAQPEEMLVKQRCATS